MDIHQFHHISCFRLNLNVTMAMNALQSTGLDGHTLGGGNRAEITRTVTEHQCNAKHQMKNLKCLEMPRMFESSSLVSSSSSLLHSPPHGPILFCLNNSRDAPQTWPQTWPQTLPQTWPQTWPPHTAASSSSGLSRMLSASLQEWKITFLTWSRSSNCWPMSVKESFIT